MKKNQTNQSFQTFNKKHPFITVDNGKFDVPDFVLKAFSAYRFDEEKLELQKSCYMCKKWFPIAKLENKKWEDIHDEKNMHLVPSGFGTYCIACSKIKEKKSENSIENKVKSIGEKYSIYLLDEQKKYIKIRAALQDKTITKVLEEIIVDEMKKNPLEKLI